MNVSGHALHDMSDVELEKLYGKTAKVCSDDKLLAAIEEEQERRSVAARRSAAAAKITQGEEEDAATLRKHETAQRKATAANDAAKRLAESHQGLEKAAKELMAKRVVVRQEQDVFLALLSEALGHAPDGDTTFSALEDAQKQYMVFHGFGSGLKERIEPSIYDAGQRVLNNFLGQLRIHAQKHGITVPK